MVFSEAAPAPLIATPMIPTEAAKAAAEATERISASSRAETEIPPLWVVTEPKAPLAALREISAVVLLLIRFSASVTATEPESDRPPPARLIATAPALASIDERLVALRLTEASVSPVAEPRMAARLSEAIRLSASTPEPERAKPTIPPATAIEPAKTLAVIAWLLAAVTVSAPRPVLAEVVFSTMAEVKPRPATRFARMS